MVPLIDTLFPFLEIFSFSLLMKHISFTYKNVIIKLKIRIKMEKISNVNIDFINFCFFFQKKH